MNYRLLSKYLGHFSLAIALFMLPSLLCALYYNEWRSVVAFIESMFAACIFGVSLTIIGRGASEQFFQREALALVGIGWLISGGLGALPFIAAGLLSPVDAMFESVSGFTTTGATVITDIEATDKGLLFWRSFTHWLGGMGIIVLFIAVLPYLGAGGKQLFRSESTGPDPRGLRPRIKNTASILWRIYLALTLLQTVLLMLAGMNLFDALCHTFGTLATGGFSTRQASVAAYDSVAVEIIIIIFMGLAGTNFGLFFAMRRGDWLAPFKSTEWRVYVIILIVASLLIMVNLVGIQGDVALGPEAAATSEYSLGGALRTAAFQVVSIMTTTGYATENFDAWPQFSRTLLFLLMFVGGCAGSTGGGVKVVRVIMLAKMAYWRLESTFRPKTVRPIRVDTSIVDESTQKTVYGFFVLYMGIFAFGTLFMALLGLPLETAFSAVAATLNNIGPGLQHVGAVHDYSFIPPSGKLFLTLCMVMGRLELFSICVFFIPSFWRQG